MRAHFFDTPAPLATVIDRPVFDRALADRAIAAGAEIRGAARVTAIDVDADGVRAAVSGGIVAARLVVLACGATYKFQRHFGFGLPTTYFADPSGLMTWAVLPPDSPDLIRHGGADAWVECRGEKAVPAYDPEFLRNNNDECGKKIVDIAR